MPLVTVRLRPPQPAEPVEALGAPTPKPTCAEEKHLLAVANLLHLSKRCVVVTGAGISCNGGIPDFRSSDGLYNLVKERYPKSVVRGRDLFDASLFRDATSTQIFCSFVGELKQIIDEARCTPTHMFIGKLHCQGKLLRCYTQNIDCLEQQAGLVALEDEFSVEERSSFGVAHAGSGDCQHPSDARTSNCLERGGPCVLDAAERHEESRPSGREGPSLLQRKPSTDRAQPSSKPKKKPRAFDAPPLVQLHGTLQRLNCTLCSASFPFTDDYRDIFKNGQSPQCPACEKQAEARLLAGKRRVASGRLRPSIVLYNEPHPRGELIGKAHTADIRRRPDLLLVMGTSLKVTGLKRLVKDIAKCTHAAGGSCIFVNRTEAAPTKEWSAVFDYQILADTDEWVGDVDKRMSRLRGPRQLTLVKSSESNLALSLSKPAADSPPAANASPESKENHAKVRARKSTVAKGKTVTITSHFKSKKVTSVSASLVGTPETKKPGISC